MKKVTLLFFLLTFSVFSQEIEYNRAKSNLSNNELYEATSNIQAAIRKAKNNKSKYYLLYAGILKNKNVVDSSLYYYNKVETDYLKRKVKDSLLLTLSSKLEFYRLNNKKNDVDFYLKRLSQFQFNQIKNKDIVAYALNRKLSVLNEFHYANKDTVKLIDEIGKQILRLKNQITNKVVIAYTLNEIAQIEDYRGDKNKAFAKYEVALKYAEENNLLNPQIDISYNLAALYSRYKKDNKKAVEILEKLMVKVEEGSNITQKHSFFLQIKNYYREINRYEDAFIAFDKAYKYLQEINNQQSYFKLTALERKYDLEKKELKIKENENEIKIKNIEIKNSAKKFWLVLIIFLLTTLGVLTLTYFFRKEKKSNKQLRVLSAENEFLIAEANHRINNNLQLIIILISDQIEKLKEKEGKEIKKILVKINSIATLHKHLYKSKNKKEIDVEKYLIDIEKSFSDLFKENNIVSNFNATSINLKIDEAMYLGLILTELYINSIKHAFINQDNKQITFFMRLENNKIFFKYQDNGKNSNTHDNIKPVLIDQLCRQLEVTYKIQTELGFGFSFYKQISK
jgi:two-component sensor histidine kinase